jgi:hypothetical protein
MNDNLQNLFSLLDDADREVYYECMKKLTEIQDCNEQLEYLGGFLNHINETDDLIFNLKEYNPYPFQKRLLTYIRLLLRRMLHMVWAVISIKYYGIN